MNSIFLLSLLLCYLHDNPLPLRDESLAAKNVTMNQCRKHLSHISATYGPESNQTTLNSTIVEYFTHKVANHSLPADFNSTSLCSVFEKHGFPCPFTPTPVSEPTIEMISAVPAYIPQLYNQAIALGQNISNWAAAVQNNFTAQLSNDSNSIIQAWEILEEADAQLITDQAAQLQASINASQANLSQILATVEVAYSTGDQALIQFAVNLLNSTINTESQEWESQLSSLISYVETVNCTISYDEQQVINEINSLAPPCFAYLNNTSSSITLNQVLTPLTSILSPNKQYNLTLQYDGNFVLYNTYNYGYTSVVWGAGTYSNDGGASYINVTASGELIYGNPAYPNFQLTFVPETQYEGSNAGVPSFYTLTNNGDLLLCSTTGQFISYTVNDNSNARTGSLPQNS